VLFFSHKVSGLDRSFVCPSASPLYEFGGTRKIQNVEIDDKDGWRALKRAQIDNWLIR
jgi:hypothetical protein